MQTGAVLSQNELGPELSALRDYAHAVQDLGYDFLVTADHVVGSDAADHPELDRVYPIDNYLREPLMLGAFLACAAPKLGYLTSVVILPQRQTVLAAKQAADLDGLTQGKLRLGVGIGWNPIEFTALGMGFASRARRFEEQIQLMRKLWTERVVSFEGRFDKRDFVYDERRDEYRCPAGQIAIRRFTAIEHGKTLHRYWTSACPSCPIKAQCTPSDYRRITRWEHESVLDMVQERLDGAPEAARLRRQTVEHVFGTLKAWMGSTHFLTKRLPGVGTEMSLHVLAYNLKRAIKVLGVQTLIAAMQA